MVGVACSAGRREGLACLVEVRRIEELADPRVELRHDGGLADVDVLRVVEAGNRRAIAGELAAVVLGVVIHVPLHPVTAEATVHAAAQDIGSLRRTRLASRRAVSPGSHLSLSRHEDFGADDRLVRLLGRPDPVGVVVAAHPGEVALCHILDVDEDLVAPLVVPDLAAGVAGVHEDGADRDLRLRPLVPVPIAGRVVSAGRGDAISGEVLSDGEVAAAGDVLGEDPIDDGLRMVNL